MNNMSLKDLEARRKENAQNIIRTRHMLERLENHEKELRFAVENHKEYVKGKSLL